MKTRNIAASRFFKALMRCQVMAGGKVGEPPERAIENVAGFPAAWDKVATLGKTDNKSFGPGKKIALPGLSRLVDSGSKTGHSSKISPCSRSGPLTTAY